jgi:hypothetical protein
MNNFICILWILGEILVEKMERVVGLCPVEFASVPKVAPCRK